MVKKIRFDLKLSGRNVGTLEELRENFELERIFQYYNDGKLEKWHHRTSARSSCTTHNPGRC